MIERRNRIPALFTASAFGFFGCLPGAASALRTTLRPHRRYGPDYKDPPSNFQDSGGWESGKPQAR